jgi:hypothetical protein
MKTRIREQKQGSTPDLKRLIFLFVSTLLLIVVGAIIWILSIAGLIGGTWSSIVGVIFTALGVILALFQWYAQANSGSPTLLTDLSPHKRSQQNPLFPTESIKLGINKQKGALIVYTSKKLCGTTIHLCKGFDASNLHTDSATNVIHRRIHGHDRFIGVFPSLEPSNYTVYTNQQEYLSHTTIYADHLAEIDWRYRTFRE